MASHNKYFPTWRGGGLLPPMHPIGLIWKVYHRTKLALVTKIHSDKRYEQICFGGNVGGCKLLFIHSRFWAAILMRVTTDLFSRLKLCLVWPRPSEWSIHHTIEIFFYFSRGGTVGGCPQGMWGPVPTPSSFCQFFKLSQLSKVLPVTKLHCYNISDKICAKVNMLRESVSSYFSATLYKYCWSKKKYN